MWYDVCDMDSYITWPYQIADHNCRIIWVYNKIPYYIYTYYIYTYYGIITFLGLGIAFRLLLPVYLTRPT